MSGLARAGVGLLAGGAVFNTLQRGLRFIVDEGQEARKTLATTTALLRTTGGVANVTAEGIERIAGRLSDAAAVDDEFVAGLANVLLTFKNVRNEVGQGNNIFDRAVASALNLGSIFGSAESAIVQVGKALENPVKGLTALTRSGVTFTDQEAKKIEKLVESNRLLEAQRVLLEAIEGQSAGAAEAAATPIDRLGVSIGNLAEAGSATLLPVLDGMATAASFLADTLTGLPTPIREVGSAIAYVAGVVLLAKVGLVALRASLGVMGVDLTRTAVASSAAAAGSFAHTNAMIAEAAATGRLAFAQRGVTSSTWLATGAIEAQTVAALEASGVFGGTAAAVGIFGTGLGAVPFAAGIAGFAALATAAANFFDQLESRGGLLDILGQGLRRGLTGLPVIGAAFDPLFGESTAKGVNELFDSFGKGADESDDLTESIKDQAAALEKELNPATKDAAESNDRLREANQKLRAAERERLGVIREMAHAHRDAAQAARDQVNSQLSLAGGIVGIQSAQLSASGSARDLASARRRVNQLESQGRQGTVAYKEAVRALDEAQVGAIEGELGLANAVAQYVNENANSAASTRVAIQMLNDFGARAGLTEGEVANLTGTVRGLIHEYRNIPSVRETFVEFEHREALKRIAQLRREMAKIDRKILIQTGVVGTAGSTTSTGHPLTYEEAVARFKADPSLTDPTPKVEVKIDGRKVQESNRRRQLLLGGG